ncbi:NACHT domain-containing NTPase [Nonomuraea sp. MTCD27]|uniref:NACHT domain-containing protein n=1 Tax=Nonomuraea sp. MTCD27 TaxID=1676747 RepID=UPI0035C0444D
MRQILTYRDAVVLLGGPSRLTNVLDKASSIALFGTGGIDLFDARAEAVRLGDAFLRGLRDKVKGLSRHDTTQRLAAAHTVIVIAAYLEVLAEVDVLRELTPEDQRRITGIDGFGQLLTVTTMPMPTPAVPHEKVLDELLRSYSALTGSLVRFLSGLARWDAWDETTRARLSEDIPPRAVRRYEEFFRRLVAEFPEVACWSDLVGHQATREEVRNLARGLAGIQEQLARIPPTRGPSDRLAALIRSNRAALRRPIVTSARTPAGMTIPVLDQGYVNPGFRLLEPFWNRLVTSEETWAALPRRHDLDAFLAGHLTLPQATEAPLLVLGQPGAGKSVLTRVLAARLPAEEFLPLRVELRGVPADGDVLAQIEHGIRAALDEAMSWPDFVHAAGGALPVVMLDGFDELLQATGVNQTDYLERVAQFQHAQAERGRALAVVVTSRTVVADRARLPEGSYVVRLEPFDDDQVHLWVTTWNHANSGYFRERGLEPLPVDRVLAVPALAEQPLLLLMLALYDADANALRLMREDLHEAELYERLLTGFAARQVRKSDEHLADAELERAVEDELLRLSITAFAMFNRGRQWVMEDDLEADLRALLPAAQEATPQAHGFRRPLTRAEGVIGGFFFVHTTQALRDQQRLKTYEFLHATFGEYLVARLVVRELADLAEELAAAESRRRPTRPDDAYLHALLSFAGLTVRAPTVDFLEYGIERLIPADRRALLTRHLCELFSQSLMARPGSAYDAYQPARIEVTARCAVHSANLLLLALLSSGEPIPGTELFRVEQPEPANELWRRIARLWHSQLVRAEWDSLTRAVRVRHFLRDGTRMMMIEFTRTPVIDSDDLVFHTWPFDAAPEQFYRLESANSTWMREISFRDDTALGHLHADLLPYVVEIDHGLAAYPHSPVADLLAVLLSPAPAYLRYERALLHGPSWAYVDRVLRQLELDAREMPGEDVLKLLRIACHRWTGPDRLMRVVRVLEDRRDLDPRVSQQAAELVLWKSKDQPSFRPLSDAEIAAMGAGDVAGDREP